MTDWRRLRRNATQPQEHRELTDASLAAAPFRRAESDPDLRRKIKLRRRALVLGLVGICFAGSLATLFGERGYLDSRRYRDEIRVLERQLKQRGGEVAKLLLRAERLDHDPTARERVAREELGFLEPGEIGFLLPRSSIVAWEPGSRSGAP